MYLLVNQFNLHLEKTEIYILTRKCSSVDRICLTPFFVKLFIGCHTQFGQNPPRCHAIHMLFIFTMRFVPVAVCSQLERDVYLLVAAHERVTHNY